MIEEQRNDSIFVFSCKEIENKIEEIKRLAKNWIYDIGFEEAKLDDESIFEAL